MSGIIPRPFIDELLNCTDIVEFIDSHVPLKKQGSSHVACCPFHSEKTPSFNVIPKKQFYHCFGCGVSGNAIGFAMEYLHQSFPEAIETLAARAGMTVPHEEGYVEKKIQTRSLHHLLEKVADFYQAQLKSNAPEAIAYLKQRGINGETAKRFQLGYAPSGWHALETAFKTSKPDLIATGMLVQHDDGKTYDRYRHRVTYPIHDRHGHIIGFGGRAIDATQKPKYLNSPETALFQKSRELYGLHYLIQEQSQHECIIIVEGYMDVIALAQHGIPNAVATLGTATSTHHIQLLSKHSKCIIFCFDGDNAGKQAAWRALENTLPFLNDGLDVRFIFLPDEHDPDSLVRKEGKEAFLARLETAMPLNQFLFKTLLQTIEIATLAGKSQLVNAVKPYLLKISDGAYHQLLLNELARLTHIDQHRLLQLLSSKAPEPTPDLDKSIHRSPTRIVVSLLLQHPDVYQAISSKLPQDKLDQLQQPIIRAIIEQIKQHPQATTGSLLEVFRNTPAYEAIQKLAAWDHQVPNEALAHELEDTLRFLAKQEEEARIQQLISKARQIGLTDIERLQLQQKLKERHQPIRDTGVSTN